MVIRLKSILIFLGLLLPYLCLKLIDYRLKITYKE